MGQKLKSNRAEFAGYSEYFEQSLEPSLLDLESRRKTRFTIGTLSAIILLPISLFVSLHMLGMAEDSYRSGRWIKGALILPFVLPMLGYVLAMSSLRKKMKTHLTSNMSAFLGWQHSKPKNISRDRDSKTLAKILYNFGAFPKHHFVQTDDILFGTHERWPFALREMTLSKQSIWSRYGPAVVFKGLVLSFRVDQRLQGEAVITRSLYSGHPRRMASIRHEGIIDSPEGRITIRASNKEVIRTILCRRFQRALIEFDEKMPDTDLSCVLYGNELHIPMTNTNLFEIDWLVNSTGSTFRVQKMLDEFSYVLQLLDVFLKPRKCTETGAIQVPEFRLLRH